MATFLIFLLMIFTLFWASLNVYNLYPLLKYWLAPTSKLKRPSLPGRLPTITVLVPAYREESVLENSIKHIFESDYPEELLDIIVLTEHDDVETIKIAREAVQKYGTKHVSVEESEHPKGKPRALNVGLQHARGEIIGVLDAEDIIHKKLFKEVAAQLNSGFSAVQGVLDMVNDRDGFKNMHLRSEYRFWYRTYLPALVHSNFPVPLGGTTNFFKRDILNELKGWDPYNLTEDFDLGLRLYNEHKRVGVVYDMLDSRTPHSIFHNKYPLMLMRSTTKEESPITWRGWLRQRTRWQRGKIQTLRKILRKLPREPIQKFHSIFMSILPHLGFINILGISFSVYIFFSNIIFPSWLFGLFTFNFLMLLFYCFMNGKSYLDVVHKNRKNRVRNAIFVALTTPVYWTMQWIADIRAMKQEYIDKRIFWEKTEHHGRHKKA